MTIIVVACLATLAVCALFSRVSQPALRKRTAKVTSLDQALVSLINDVSYKPAVRRRAYVDRVMVGSRLRSIDRPQHITVV